MQGERCLAIFSDCRGVEFDSVTPSNPTPSRREMRLKKIRLNCWDVIASMYDRLRVICWKLAHFDLQIQQSTQQGHVGCKRPTVWRTPAPVY